MKIFIASDHAGVEIKESLIGEFGSHIEFVDMGTNSLESVHYPHYAQNVCEQVLKNSSSRGILICGTGIGMSMAANRFKGIRASLCHGEFDAEMTRRHNDSNVLCLGARTTSLEEIIKMTKIWLETPFDGGKHQTRIDLFNL